MFSPRNGWDGDFTFRIWTHDERQIAIKPELVEIVAEPSKRAMKITEEFFKLRVPLDCKWKSEIMADWLYVVGSICFLLGTIINMVWR